MLTVLEFGISTADGCVRKTTSGQVPWWCPWVLPSHLSPSHTNSEESWSVVSVLGSESGCEWGLAFVARCVGTALQALAMNICVFDMVMSLYGANLNIGMDTY